MKAELMAVWLVASMAAKWEFGLVVELAEHWDFEKVALMAASRAEMMVVLKKNKRKGRIKLKPLK